MPFQTNFNVNSINVGNLIARNVQWLFLVMSTFYLLPSLKNVDDIIEYEFLKEINGMLNMENDTLNYRRNYSPVTAQTSRQIRFLSIDKESVPDNVIKDFSRIVTGNSNASSDPNRAMPFNPTVKATVRTK